MDPSGAVLPGVTVWIVNQRTNVKNSVLTNDQGYYNFLSLIPSVYRLEAELPGFKRHVQPDITLDVDQAARIDISMQLGQPTEVVNVVGEVPVLNTSYSFTNVTANHTIAAYFSINTYTITASASAGGSITPSGSVLVNYGASQSFTVTPNTGYHVDSVVVDGSNQGAITSYSFSNVTANHTISAYFSINAYTITASASAGGSINPNGAVGVSHGASQSFTITANTGYHVDSVIVDGTNQGAVTSYSFTNVTANHTISAYFSINAYTITASASAGGSISPNGAVGVSHGASQSFTITAVRRDGAPEPLGSPSLHPAHRWPDDGRRRRVSRALPQTHHRHRRRGDDCGSPPNVSYQHRSAPCRSRLGKANPQRRCRLSPLLI